MCFGHGGPNLVAELVGSCVHHGALQSTAPLLAIGLHRVVRWLANRARQLLEYLSVSLAEHLEHQPLALHLLVGVHLSFSPREKRFGDQQRRSPRSDDLQLLLYLGALGTQQGEFGFDFCSLLPPLDPHFASLGLVAAHLFAGALC